MTVGLLQYYFFPTDYYYPRQQSNNTAGKPLIVSMETQKRDDDEDHGIDQKRHQSKLMISKASVSTTSLARSPCEDASLALKKHLEEEARDLSGETFSRFVDQLYDRISTLLESNEVADNLGALRAIDQLIDVALGENASKVSKFSDYMRTVFQ
ncbi:hypothetical protein Ddye_011833 [Dipteronia dyeriana]|uniref:Uncharacterized protein n=1 Tax=Dipteronia dyeriana TaxID=168575 RepID=A0AAD9X3C3_9ROSI|nr:hypothetical protein Ddye_011833 [Dipteronia dyeriana]